MNWKCPHCGEIIENAEKTNIKFCLRCGEPVDEETTQVDSGPSDDESGERQEVKKIQRLDDLLRITMIVFGLGWLVLFVIPFGESSYGMVMSWDLLADREGMSYLVSWPLMLGLLFVVLGAVAPLPGWLRSGAAVVFATAFFVVLGVGDPGGPLGRDLNFAMVGGPVWLLIFPIVTAGLLLRSHSQRGLIPRVLIGLGLLFGIIAYLTGAEGQSTLVGALLRYLGEDSPARAISRILILLPMFLLLAAAVGFQLPGKKADPAKRWASILGWVWLIYLPAFYLLFGVMLWVAEESAYYFLMFFKLCVYLGGLTAVFALSVAWLAEFVPGRLLPLLHRKDN